VASAATLALLRAVAALSAMAVGATAMVTWAISVSFAVLPLAIGAAILAAAAVVRPARRRIQQAVDRRFNRRRHDAAQKIAAFSGCLHDQVDLDALAAALLAGGRGDDAADPGVAVAATASTLDRSRRARPWSACGGGMTVRLPGTAPRLPESACHGH
jgi:hypothetical protein